MRRLFGMFAFGCVLAAGCGFSFGSPDLGEDETIPLPSRVVGDEESPQGPPPSDDPPPKDPPPVSDAGADVGPVDAGPKTAFVSSQIVTGNLGGLAGADALCNQLATAAKLPGTYVAWLSVTGTNAIDRIPSDGPFVRVDGQLIAQTKAELASGQLKKPLSKDDKNQTPPLAEDRVWTATGSDGKLKGPDCNGWTGGGSGHVGEAEHADGRWTSLVDEACTEVNRVFCFQK